ncbi:MAG TPA: hypothetical protein VGS10_15055 [Terracidiphilus sp.]|nr:hypothetical protein [Terracidiphilus sp.]
MNFDIKTGDRSLERIAKNLHAAEIRVPWLPVVSIDGEAVSGVRINAELLYHHAKEVEIIARH